MSQTRHRITNSVYTVEPDETRLCAGCEALNAADAIYCDQCGVLIPGMPTAYAAEPDETRMCSACGAGNEPDALFCDQCASRFPESNRAWNRAVLRAGLMNRRRNRAEMQPAIIERGLFSEFRNNLRLRDGLEIEPGENFTAVRVVFPYNTPDQFNRVFEQGCFADYIREWELGRARFMVKHLWSHDEMSVPLGPVVSLADTSAGLDFVAAFDPDIDEAMEVYSAIDNGSLESYSISWEPDVIEVADNYNGNDGFYYIQRHCSALYDVSPVNFAGMPNAYIREKLGVDTNGIVLSAQLRGGSREVVPEPESVTPLWTPSDFASAAVALNTSRTLSHRSDSHG
jgi:HK97 family phage prohead protease